ncbi:MAG: WD40 repeat domain-containing protein [Pseudomonas sp.]|uniref:WD40 repeat domain-containing protein n=1 Tax=Pseudomonas sp. TaxID=306 RepID=UPI003395FDCA
MDNFLSPLIRRLRLVLPVILLVVSGCQSAQDITYEAQRATAPQLKKHFPNPIEVGVGVVGYSPDGRYFFNADPGNKVVVYSSDNQGPTVVLDFPWPLSLSQKKGAGFLDSSIFYYASQRRARGQTIYGVKVWSLDSNTEIFSYDFSESHGEDSIVAKGDFVAYDNEMVNWRTGNKYKVRIAHSAMPLDYALTASGKVLSANYYNDDILLHDPQTDTALQWDSGLSNFRSAITQGEGYVIAQANDGGCRVWPVPALKPVQSCGSGGWSDDHYALIAPHPTDDSFAVSAGGRVEVYRLVEDRFQRVFSRTLANEVTALSLSADYRVAIGDNTSHLEVWDSVQGTLLAQTDLNLSFGSELLRFSPSGKQLLYGEGHLRLHVFDIPE